MLHPQHQNQWFVPFEIQRRSFSVGQFQTICQKVSFLEFTWSFDAVTEIDGEVIDDVQQEGEVINIVHVDIIRVGGNGPQLILVSVLHTYMSRTKKSVFAI